MQAAEIDLPEVPKFNQIARFYRDDKGRDFVEISYAGTKDTFVEKVNAENMARFKAEWDAFCDGRPVEKRKGAPFSAIGMNEQRSEHYIQRNVHNLEELAALPDIHCQNLGHGTLTDRTAAQRYIAAKRDKEKRDAFDKVSESAAKIGSAPATAPPDLSEVKEQLSQLSANVGQLVQLMLAQAEKPKRGRPPKDEQE